MYLGYSVKILKSMNSCESFLSYLKYEKRYSRHTVVAYETDLNQFLFFCSKHFANLPISEMSHKHIRKWIVYLMNEACSPSTINRKLSTLRSFFKYSRRHAYLDNDPMEKVIAPKQARKLPFFMSEQQMIALEEIDFGEGFEALRDELILEMFYVTGMRLSELMNIKLLDFDKGFSQIRVLGKRQKERIIPLTDGIVSLVVKYIAARKKEFQLDKPYLFLTVKGDHVYEKLIYRVVRKYLSQLTTMKKRSPHVLRHTFATHLLNNGAELNAIKELLGHSNLSATQIYTHTSLDRLTGIYNQAHPRA